YVNTTAVISNERNCDTSAKQKQVNHDIFDMQPFAASLTSIQTESTNPLDTLIGSISNSTSLTTSSSIQSDRPISKAESERAVLLKEPWFHGAISRQESEVLVVKDGDFLVRESQNTPGQYVLTGMQNLLKTSTFS
ncbi:SHC-transforming protein 1, partial [Trichonephila clavata]